MVVHLALDELHDEVGLPLLRLASIEHTSNRRMMVHHSERLALRVEASESGGSKFIFILPGSGD